jgi:large subunit ribosomal protein L16
MLLVPKRWKHRKQFRWRIQGVAKWNTYVAFWDYGIKALENAYITSRQIESARKVLVRYNRKVGKVWIRIFPDIPYTKKWLEMPMGKGKWWVDFYVARVKRWTVMMEISWVSEEVAKEAIKQAWYKFPIKVKMVSRHEIN